MKCMQEVEALCDMLDFGGPAMVQCAKVKSMPTILPSCQLANLHNHLVTLCRCCCCLCL
jgi:hypothetical protein